MAWWDEDRLAGTDWLATQAEEAEPEGYVRLVLAALVLAAVVWLLIIIIGVTGV